MKPKLLLDIDSTIINGSWDAEDIEVRPYFKDFFLLTYNVYDHVLYTAANDVHAFHVCAALVRDWSIPPEYGMKLFKTALTRDNCPMIEREVEMEYKGEKYMLRVQEKCLDKAATLMSCSIDDIYLHIDDHPDTPRWTHQDKRLMCKPYDGDCEDTFFFTLMEKFKATGDLK